MKISAYNEWKFNLFKSRKGKRIISPLPEVKIRNLFSAIGTFLFSEPRRHLPAVGGGEVCWRGWGPRAGGCDFVYEFLLKLSTFFFLFRLPTSPTSSLLLFAPHKMISVLLSKNYSLRGGKLFCNAFRVANVRINFSKI